MQAALRPYATAGVALVGASVIAVSPVTVTPTAVQDVRDAAVALSALDNPLDIYGQMLQRVIDGATTVGQGIVDNPAPILQQLIKNQAGNIAGLPEALQAQIDALPQLPELALRGFASELANLGTLSGLGPTFLANALGAITGTGPGTLSDQLQMAIDALTENGDFAAAFGALALIPVAVLGGGFGLPNLIEVLPALSAALQQPFTDLAQVLPIAAGPLENAGAVAAALPTAALAVGVGPLLGVAGVSTNLGLAINGLIEAVQTNDPELAFNTVVEQSSLAVEQLLDAVVGPGGVVAGLQNFRTTIAQALGAPVAFASLASANALPSATAKSVTLTAPPEKTPAPKAGPSSGEDPSASGAVATAEPGTATKDSTGDATQNDNKGDPKGGNLFTPGSTTKGGKHRADNGPSFGQELRDAAAKTIKGLTGLGRNGKSDSSDASSKSGGESASSSSGSGGSSSGGDSGSN